jgi:hypothetical protein
MQCKTCQYRLWNLTSRQCPECGTPFKPSDYEFVANSVQFCCPHCNQAYYGTGEKGQLVPIEFDCVTCGQHIHIDEMVLLPTSGVEEEQTRADQMPWLERRKIGAVRAWLGTVGRALVSPGRLMQMVPLDSSAAQAWWFAVFTNIIVVTVGFGPFCVFPFVIGFAMAGRGGGGAAAPLAGFGVAWLVMLAAVCALLVLWALLAHGLLRLTGSTVAGLRRTFQGICYSAGAHALTGVPCVGLYFGWIWWVISAVLMVREGQKVHGGRAAFAVLSLPVLLLAGVVGFYAWALWFAISVAPSATATMRTPFGAAPAATQTQHLLDGLLRYARAHEGRGPSHAIELATVEGANLTAMDFAVAGTATSTSKVPVADMTLDQFLALNRYEERSAVTKAAEALPPGTIAHRLGDFVFAYHGIDVTQADPRLWLLMLSPDPDSNDETASAGGLLVGLANGATQWIAGEQFPARLAEQNGLRAEHGLPPLPDPATVTHSRPVGVSGE